MKKQITIIGGGIAGLTTAIALNKAGFDTIVFEAASVIGAVGAGLGLGPNAMKGFEKLGIMEEVMQRGRQLPSFSIYTDKGKLISRNDSTIMSAKYGIDNFTIHRASLHELLLSKVDRTTVFTNKRGTCITQKTDSATIHFSDGTTHSASHVIVADGISSPIRKQLVPQSEPRYAGYTCWRGVTDNTTLNINETSETWGTKGRFGIVPLSDNKIYWFACLNAPQNSSSFKNFKSTQLSEIFDGFHKPIPDLVKATKDEHIIWNDIVDLKPLKQYAFGNILLIGDAAHATTPNLGQGAGQAIEDAVILADELSKINDIQQAFKQFEKRRFKRTHFIINLSRRVGQAAQTENKILVGIRNFILKFTPDSVNQKQFDKIYSIDF